MITSRTIQHNSDRAYDILFILLSHNEENDQKMGFRDLKCRNGAQNQNLREKLSKTGHVEKFWLWSKSTVNGQSQRSTDDVCWCGSVTSPRADMAGREAATGAWTGVWGAREARDRYRRRVEAHGARARKAETSAGAWRRVWCSLWPFLVGFCSGLAVLSFYAFSLAVECVERWYPSVASTVGVTAVARFWQWRLDEGEGSGRTLEMSTGTRKSEEWLWYHVNNIKWERKTE